MKSTQEARAGEPTFPMIGPNGKLRQDGELAAPARAPLLAPGVLIDKHIEITALLGSGGMAEVYLGVDRWLRREVAIKATSLELAEHLEREAQVLASFRHPGLVTAHAYGHHERVPYVVLEYLHGKSLTQELSARESGGYPVDDALRLVVGVAEALMPLHERGLVHCDLKPGNIMCTPSRVVLIDLGLVWDTRSETRRTTFSGSPPFMAPEAIAGQVQPGQAHLIDVYALGMLLYVLLAGSPPFSDTEPSRLMSRQLAEEAPSLSTRRNDLPPRLSAIVSALIHRDPNERPRDVTAVRDALVGIPRRGADRR